MKKGKIIFTTAFLTLVLGGGLAVGGYYAHKNWDKISSAVKDVFNKNEEITTPADKEQNALAGYVFDGSYLAGYTGTETTLNNLPTSYSRKDVLNGETMTVTYEDISDADKQYEMILKMLGRGFYLTPNGGEKIFVTGMIEFQTLSQLNDEACYPLQIEFCDTEYFEGTDYEVLGIADPFAILEFSPGSSVITEITIPATFDFVGISNCNFVNLQKAVFETTDSNNARYVCNFAKYNPNAEILVNYDYYVANYVAFYEYTNIQPIEGEYSEEVYTASFQLQGDPFTIVLDGEATTSVKVLSGDTLDIQIPNPIGNSTQLNFLGWTVDRETAVDLTTYEITSDTTFIAMLEFKPTLSVLEIEDGVVTGYTGSVDGLVVIPETYSLDADGNLIEGTDYTVTEIKADVFSCAMDVSTIVLPKTLTTIDVGTTFDDAGISDFIIYGAPTDRNFNEKSDYGMSCSKIYVEDKYYDAWVTAWSDSTTMVAKLTKLSEHEIIG